MLYYTLLNGGRLQLPKDNLRLLLLASSNVTIVVFNALALVSNVTPVEESQKNAQPNGVLVSIVLVRNTPRLNVAHVFAPLLQSARPIGLASARSVVSKNPVKLLAALGASAIPLPLLLVKASAKFLPPSGRSDALLFFLLNYSTTLLIVQARPHAYAFMRLVVSRVP